MRGERFVIAPSFQIPVSRIDVNLTTLAEYQGSLLLIVNVASACDLTPQYAALESVYEKFHTRGFVVLGFRATTITLKSQGRQPHYSHLITAQPKAHSRPPLPCSRARVLRCWSEAR
jgi:glutathione peroxidase-family protein